MLERLKYWILQKGKNCHYCCLRCEYYERCRNEVIIFNSHEPQEIETKTTDGTEITIRTIPAKERRLQRKMIKKAGKRGRT